MIGPDEGVRRAALTHSCPTDHVVSGWAGDTGGASVSGAGGAQRTAAALRGHTPDHIGDVDGEDLRRIRAVFPLLSEEKHNVVFCQAYISIPAFYFYMFSCCSCAKVLLNCLDKQLATAI